jgi:hypothetical protein
VKTLAIGGIAAALLAGGGGARNLVATPAVKAALRSAFVHAHSRFAAAQIKGPLPGTTYYGSAGGFEYAVATFSVPRFATQDQPEIFRRTAGGRWRDLGDTGGDVCPGVVPLSLLRVWHFVPSAKTRVDGVWVQCYAPASRG